MCISLLSLWRIKKGTPEIWSFFPFQSHILTISFMLSFVTKSILLVPAISCVLFSNTHLRDAVDLLYQETVWRQRELLPRRHSCVRVRMWVGNWDVQKGHFLVCLQLLLLQRWCMSVNRAGWILNVPVFCTICFSTFGKLNCKGLHSYHLGSSSGSRSDSS